jgi:hypothetical protein
MPVIDDPRPSADGLYQAVRERVEEHARLHAERLAAWHVDPADHPYALQRVLNALRAGEPTDVPDWAIPQSARGGQRMTRGRTTSGRREAVCFYVEIVRPDDTIELKPDSWAKWFEYNGLS